jgi:hypothetical protein
LGTTTFHTIIIITATATTSSLSDDAAPRNISLQPREKQRSLRELTLSLPVFLHVRLSSSITNHTTHRRFPLIYGGTDERMNVEQR